MMDLIFKGINIAILLGVVYFFLRKKATAYFATQRDELERDMKKAASELQKIETEYLEVSKKLSELDTQLQLMREQNEESIRRESEKLKKDSELFVQKISRDAELRMDREAEKISQEFKKELVEAALASARAELSSKLLKHDETWTVKMVSDVLAAEKAGGERANYAS